MTMSMKENRLADIPDPVDIDGYLSKVFALADITP